VRSSPAFAGSDLEVPAVTLAERASAVLPWLAAAFAAWVCARHELALAGVLPVLLAACVTARQNQCWTRSRSRPALVVEYRTDRVLRVRLRDDGPFPAVLGGGTRLLGPSVFLDLRFAVGGRQVRCRRWLTVFDVPADTLRRWTVVLPTCGRVACS
jgi:hypothetical protein